MQPQYYVVINDSQTGPYEFSQLQVLNIKPETLVWRQGMPDWAAASTLPELSVLFQPQTPPPHAADPARGSGSYSVRGWYAMKGGFRIGPESVENLRSMGVDGNTPVWHPGMADWKEARFVPEFNQQTQQPPYGYQGSQNVYGQPTSDRTNWMTWAIVGTVCGFLFSCIGCIFGILGIVNANKANNYFAMGSMELGDRANKTAKTMTIISLVVAGLGIIGTGLWWHSFAPMFRQMLTSGAI